MGKGSYLGGGAVVGFRGSFTGAGKPKVTQAMEVDAHLTQKNAIDQARQVADRPKKAKKKPVGQRAKGKPKPLANKPKRPKSRKSQGVDVGKKIGTAEAKVSSIEREIAKAKRLLWTLERDLHRAKVELSEAQQQRRLSPAGSVALETKKFRSDQ